MERLRQLGRLHYDLRIEVSNTPGPARALSIQCPPARSSLSRPYSTSLATSQQEMMLTPKTRSTPRSSALAVFNSACLKLCNAKSLERVSRVAAPSAEAFSPAIPRDNLASLFQSENLVVYQFEGLDISCCTRSCHRIKQH